MGRGGALAAAALGSWLPEPAAGSGWPRTPPMGYNTWNDVQWKPTQNAILQTALAMKEKGLLDAGYEYVVCDDGWQLPTRTADGRLKSTENFPSMQNLSSTLHSLGFKFGLYTSRGIETCVGRAGSMGHEKVDAQTFIEWDIDFLKNDGCTDPDCGRQMIQLPDHGDNSCRQSGRKLALAKYRAMFDGLRAAGKPIVHSICGWQPWYAPTGSSVGHMWRIAKDTKFFIDIYQVLSLMEKLGEFHKPGSFNDPDMLVGSHNGSSFAMTPMQSRAQFSLWCLISAPLFLGTSALKMSQHDVETYTNKDAIAVNQDMTGLPVQVIFSNCPDSMAFKWKIDSEGTPDFDIFVAGRPYVENINKRRSGNYRCGGTRRKANCTDCDEGEGMLFCKNDCVWKAHKNERQDPQFNPRFNGTCVLMDPVLKKDRWSPWEQELWDGNGKKMEPKDIECQYAIAKRLGSGEVALAAVNFGKLPGEVDLPLNASWVPWLCVSAGSCDEGVGIRDLWQGRSGDDTDGGTVLQTRKSLRLTLEPLGGHVMLVLSRLTAADAEGGGAPEPAGNSQELLYPSIGNSDVSWGSGTVQVLCLVALLIFTGLMMCRRLPPRHAGDWSPTATATRAKTPRVLDQMD